MDDVELVTLKDKCDYLESALNDLRGEYSQKIDELETVRLDLQKKTDLCTMYEHVLQAREDKIDQLAAMENDYTSQIADLRTTVDTLSIRIAKLKDDIQRK